MSNFDLDSPSTKLHRSRRASNTKNDEMAGEFGKMARRQSRNIQSFVSPKTNPVNPIEMVFRKQTRLLERFKQNESKYVQALTKISNDIGQIKKRTNFIRVENGQTIEEYMGFRNQNEQRDKGKRYDCLNLLNLYANSLPENNRRNYQHIMDIQKRSKLAPPVDKEEFSRRRSVRNHASYDQNANEKAVFNFNLLPLSFAQGQR